ncbi:MAG: hypothetical protein U1E65_33415 [Myxococcota bacterium]
MSAPVFGPLELGLEEPCRVAVGTLELWIERGAKTWKLATRRIPRQTAPSKETVGLAWPTDLVPAVHGAPQGTTGLELRPVTPGRRVVFSPTRTLVIHPGDALELWAEIPLSLVALSKEAELCRLPLLPQKETWFGPSTVDGELAYAVRGEAPLVDRLPGFNVDVARTKLRVENGGARGLTLERVLLPAPSLSLWSDPDGRLYTQAVSVRTDQDAHLAKVSVADGPPREALEPKPTSGPRPRTPSTFEVDLERVLFGA